MGDFIRFHSKSIGQVRGLVIVSLSTTDPPRLFLKLAVAVQQQEVDPVLEIPMYRISPEEIIVGLPGVEPSRPYLVPVSRSSQDRQLTLRQITHGQILGQEALELLYVPWNVEYL